MGLFKQQMAGQVLEQITKQAGLGDQNQASSAAENVFSTLLGAVSKNAATEQGAASLNKALENDHDGGVMDDLMGLLGGNNNSRAANGSGILKHMLGGKQESIVQGLSKVNNMSPDATQSMMQSIAPMVMGMLGKAKSQQGFDAGSIASFLGQQQAPQQSNQLSGLMSMLDQDGDGSIVDDVTDMLGGFFGKK